MTRIFYALVVVSLFVAVYCTGFALGQSDIRKNGDVIFAGLPPQSR